MKPLEPYTLNAADGPLEAFAWRCLGVLLSLVVTGLIAAAVHFTLPALKADSVACAPPIRQVSLTDLDSVFVWMQPLGTSRASLVMAASVRGLEGQAMTVQIPTDSVATVWVQTSNVAGVRSCKSNEVGVNLTLGAPLPEDYFRGKALWFDVAGRRVTPPLGPGIYYVRRGREQARAVVIVR